MWPLLTAFLATIDGQYGNHGAHSSIIPSQADIFQLLVRSCGSLCKPLKRGCSEYSDDLMTIQPAGSLHRGPPADMALKMQHSASMPPDAGATALKILRERRTAAIPSSTCNKTSKGSTAGKHQHSRHGNRVRTWRQACTEEGLPARLISVVHTLGGPRQDAENAGNRSLNALDSVPPDRGKKALGGSTPRAPNEIGFPSATPRLNRWTMGIDLDSETPAGLGPGDERRSHSLGATAVVLGLPAFLSVSDLSLPH